MGTMRYDIVYRTSIHYDDVVRGSQNELRACPSSEKPRSVLCRVRKFRREHPHHPQERPELPHP